MALTKNYPYDNPNYTAIDVKDLPEFTGAAATSQKFTTFTSSLLLKSVMVRPTTAGTSNDVSSLIAVNVSGTTTTTTTVALSTFGSGVTTPSAAVAVGATNSPAGLTFNAGDYFYVVKGTDATLKLMGQAEVQFAPGTYFSP
jgi:hypothetical protein